MTINSQILAGRHFHPSKEDQAADRDMIFIKDLVLDCAIGVYDHEKTKRQKVRFNVEIDVIRAVEPLADSIGQVVSYAKVADGIKVLAGGEHINLVETLAERVADLCLMDHRALRARVRVEKLEIEPDAVAVGVEITRRQSPYGPSLAASNPMVTALTFGRRPGGGPEDKD